MHVAKATVQKPLPDRRNDTIEEEKDKSQGKNASLMDAIEISMDDPPKFFFFNSSVFLLSSSYVEGLVICSKPHCAL